MKRIKLIYTLLLAAILPLLTACSSDDLANSSDPNKQGDKVTVTLRISPAGSTPTMRAGAITKDEYAETYELMNNWTVVVTDEENNVKHILTGIPQTEEEKEIDPIETELELETGTYNFYSFANIGASNLNTLLGFPNGTIPQQTTEVTITTPPTGSKFPAGGKTLADYTAEINGNCFDPTANDNGFGSQGIPMSNMQEITVDESTKTNPIDLIVVRMLAKIELWLYNDYGNKDLKIESITLTDITQNSEDTGSANLKLFPYYTKNGANEKVDYEHGDIRPNLIEGATKDDLTIIPSTSGVIVSRDPSNTLTPSDPDPWTVYKDANKYSEKNNYPDASKAVKITFYVNESANPQGESFFPSTSSTPSTHEAEPTPTPQKFYHYFLKIKINGEEEQRFTLIDDNGTQAGEKWNYIARNDYRIIPIVLDDYKLDMIPYDFPAIGVLPASVKEEDGIYTINFHDYGHFHLLPQVTRYSGTNNSKTPVPYIDQNATTYWTLGSATGSTPTAKLSELTSAWGSWIDASKDDNYVNDEVGGGDTKYSDFNNIAFYKSDYNPTTIKDGDEVGGEPVWYLNENDEESPQWTPTPNGTTYQPFIFGYIADPFPNGTQTDKLGVDRKVYHEFTINLHKTNATPAVRQMTYRLYMILDTDQMLYRSNSAPRVRPPHCLH